MLLTTHINNACHYSYCTLLHAQYADAIEIRDLKGCRLTYLELYKTEL